MQAEQSVVAARPMQMLSLHVFVQPVVHAQSFKELNAASPSGEQNGGAGCV